MDPNYFVMDFGRVSEALLAIVVLSLLVERALALVFESRFFLEHIEYRITRKEKPRPEGSTTSADEKDAKTPVQGKIIGLERKAPSGIKEGIAFGVAFFVCFYWKFDALSVIMPVHPTETVLGMIITAAVIAGGSKAAIRLFKDWLEVKSSAKTEIEEFKKSQALKK